MPSLAWPLFAICIADDDGNKEGQPRDDTGYMQGMLWKRDR